MSKTKNWPQRCDWSIQHYDRIDRLLNDAKTLCKILNYLSGEKRKGAQHWKKEHKTTLTSTCENEHQIIWKLPPQTKGKKSRKQSKMQPAHKQTEAKDKTNQTEMD